MRANRLLSILLLLQNQGTLTAGELAKRLEVSERTVLRDMEALSIAGIPVAANRGRGGGWYLVEGYRTNLTGLHSDELQALLLAAPQRLLADLGLEKAGEQAALKLLAALPSVLQSDASKLRERIHIDGTLWFGDDETTACLPLLQDAVWREQRTIIDYKRGDGETVTRAVDPLGLVAKGRIWYLIAAVEGDLRTYRVSRIQQAHTTDERFTRPEHFDLADYWRQSTRAFVANLPRLPAVLQIQEDAIWLIQSWRWATIQSSVPTTDKPGWHTVDMLFETLEEAAGCILGCGGRALVVEPDELIAEVRRQVHSLTAAYSVP